MSKPRKLLLVVRADVPRPALAWAMACQPCLVELDAKSGGRRQSDVAVFDLERLTGQFSAGCFEVDEVFGNEKVRDARRDLQRAGQSDRGAVVVMGRDRHMPRLGHCRDLLQSQDAA